MLHRRWPTAQNATVASVIVVGEQHIGQRFLAVHHDTVRWLATMASDYRRIHRGGSRCGRSRDRVHRHRQRFGLRVLRDVSATVVGLRLRVKSGHRIHGLISPEGKQNIAGQSATDAFVGLIELLLNGRVRL